MQSQEFDKQLCLRGGTPLHPDRVNCRGARCGRVQFFLEERNKPSRLDLFADKRAGAKKVVVVKGASHVVMMSQPAAVAQIIDEAVAATVK
jgi:ribosomal protein L40E